MSNLQNLLNKAIQIATEVHAGQVDKGGKPYIEHPLRVMNNVDPVEAKIVGVLHDVIEDSSNLTVEDLTQLGFPQNIVEAVDAITKRPGEKYNLYLQRVMSNQLALTVKIADMTDNLDLTRIPNPTEKDYQRLKKYQKNIIRLKNIQE